MKAIVSLVLGVLLVASQAWAEGSNEDVKGYVIGPKSTDTHFAFVAEVMGDNCNNISIDIDLQLLSSDKAAGKRTYNVDVATMQTVMACEDMRPVLEEVTSGSYKVPAGDQVKFIVPSWVSVRLLRK